MQTEAATDSTGPTPTAASTASHAPGEGYHGSLHLVQSSYLRGREVAHMRLPPIKLCSMSKRFAGLVCISGACVDLRPSRGIVRQHGDGASDPNRHTETKTPQTAEPGVRHPSMPDHQWQSSDHCGFIAPPATKQPRAQKLCPQVHGATH